MQPAHAPPPRAMALVQLLGLAPRTIFYFLFFSIFTLLYCYHPPTNRAIIVELLKIGVFDGDNPNPSCMAGTPSGKP
jgi:hypothetical protein